MIGHEKRNDGGAVYRLGCDVGGTFTDFVLLNRDTGAYDVHKVLTTHDDPSSAIAAGAAHVDRRRQGAARGTEYIIHGTTLVINAILKRRGANTAILTTEGFADILAIRREIRYDIYDLDSDYPTPLIEKSLRREIKERVSSDGNVLIPLDRAQVKDVLGELVGSGIRSIAVCFLHSYINPMHEEAVAEVAAQHFPELQISLSSRVLREVREFERTSTTALNAYVRPLIAPYLNRLEEQLAKTGYPKRVYMMLSGGGIIAPKAAIEFPVRMVESGPVGGALAAAHLAEKARIKNLIVFDVGGTTAKTTLLRDGQLAITTEYEVDRVHRFKKGSGTPIAVPCVDLIEIGTGGGSIAGIIKLGLLLVGPLSAESSPGPACYGLGGKQATVTDANLLLGYLDASSFMGGEMALDSAAAAKSVSTNVGEKLELADVEAAWAIHDVANENMASSIRMFLAEKGMDPTQTAMLAFGGGGPLHASSIARKLGVKRIIVPRAAGVFSALGFLVAPVAYQVSRSQVADLASLSLADLDRVFGELAHEARAEVQHVVASASVSELHEVDLCYSGQGSTVRVNADGLASLSELRDRFATAYRQLYGHSYDDLPLQVITMRVTASSAQAVPNVMLPFSAESLPAPSKVRQAYSPISGRYVDYAVYDIDSLTAGAVINGPVLIEEKSSTLVAHEDSRVVVNPNGWLEVEMMETAISASTSSRNTVGFQILWSRIVNIADEMAITLVRTAFSHVVRENQDFGCGLYDASGRMLAQSTHCTPGHIGAMPIVVKKMLEKFPAGDLRPGDVLITNDPWLGAGHTPDFFLTTPIFRDKRLLGFAVNCAHHIDVGGRMGAPDARQVYEEGVIVPIMKFHSAGVINQDLLNLIERNVRMPEKVIGDLRAQVAANNVAARRLAALADEWKLECLDDLATDIIDFTEKAMRLAVAEIPDGVYEATTPIRDVTEDGSEITIKVKITVEGSDVTVDFSGTSPQVSLPINSVYNITYAYTLFPLKCALHPHIPNNEGCARPITLIVPEGCVLNAQFPAACMWRTSTVYSALEAIFEALSQAIPEKLMAPSGTYPLWGTIFRGEHNDGRSFVAHFNAQGGQGARFAKDGVATTVFPPNVMNTPVEMFEAETPILCERKALVPDSGGAGRQRGGNGQHIAMRNLGQHTIIASIIGGRLEEGACGLAGGKRGGTGAIHLNGEKLHRSRQVVLNPGDRIEMTYPGGGGFGSPNDRDRDAIVSDIRSGAITPEAASRDYGLSSDSLRKESDAQIAAE